MPASKESSDKPLIAVLNVDLDLIVYMPISDQQVIDSNAIYHHLCANMPACSDEHYQMLASKLDLAKPLIFENYEYLIERARALAADLGYKELPYKMMIDVFKGNVEVNGQRAKRYGMTFILSNLAKIVRGICKIDVSNNHLADRTPKVSDVKIANVSYDMAGVDRDNWALTSEAEIYFTLSIEEKPIEIKIKNSAHGLHSETNIIGKTYDGAVNYLLRNEQDGDLTTEDAKVFIDKFAEETGITLKATEITEYVSLIHSAATQIIERFIEFNMKTMIYYVMDKNNELAATAYENLGYIEVVWSVLPSSDPKTLTGTISKSFVAAEIQARFNPAVALCKTLITQFRYEHDALEKSYQDLVIRCGQLDEIRKQENDSDQSVLAAINAYHVKRGVGLELAYIKRALITMTQKHLGLNDIKINYLQSRLEDVDTVDNEQKEALFDDKYS